MFGDDLLEGRMKLVNNFIHKCRGDPECIILEILQTWLEGRGRKPVTWETFVTALERIRLQTLARDIRQCLPTIASSVPQETTTGTADEPPPTPAPGMMSMCCVGTYMYVFIRFLAMYMLRPDSQLDPL